MKQRLVMIKSTLRSLKKRQFKSRRDRKFVTRWLQSSFDAIDEEIDNYTNNRKNYKKNKKSLILLLKQIDELIRLVKNGWIKTRSRK